MELLKLTDNEFKQMAKLVYDRTGIYLPENKLSLLSNRLRKRLRSLDLDSFQAYYELLCDVTKCDEELPSFLSAITTNETYLFRNQVLWRFFRETWIPQVVEAVREKSRKSIRIWSAACSSGEEAYTAAICLRECLPKFETWRVGIVASDISQRVLDQAAAGLYNDYAVSKTPKDVLRKWFDRQEDGFLVKPELRRLVTFQFHNLRDRFPHRDFDLIFLRNVLMYFDTSMKQRVLKHVTYALAHGGHLVVGDVDPIRNTPELNDVLELDYCGPNLYRKPEKSRRPAVKCAKG